MDQISYDSLIETLTFLFTDIEGSTALLRRLGEVVYARVLADHQRIIRAALHTHDGQERAAQGDAFFATFTSPRACVSAALEMQYRLGSHGWPDGESLRVRMGVHTGEVAEVAAGLVGYEVHRAARIAAVGHGGQVLLSSAAAGLVRDALPAEVALRELGSHRLKDLGQPETIFQLVAPGLERDFPPLRSLDNPGLAHNLPASLSTFVGRSSELAEVRHLVETSRLVTLTGAGGSGKTRLALQAVVELLDTSDDGVWFVELAAVSDPEQIPAAVMKVLQLRFEPGVHAMDSLVRSLRAQNLLLVLDNCEHVIDAVAAMAELITRQCPRVSLVATSREPLGVEGERVYRVRSLSLPDEAIALAEDLEGSDAVDLFIARAQAHDSTFEIDDIVAPLVASMCRRLDGIPLAIELAASRLSSMSLDDLHDRLDQRFRLLTGGSRNALPRQQTLAATVAWSYNLLSEPERDTLRRLSVFVGGFDLAAAEAICATDGPESRDAPDLLSSLVNKSLVIADRTAASLRYRLLETIRQYAAEQLIQTEGEEQVDRIRRLHAAHYQALCSHAAAQMEGPEQGAWLRRLDLEYDNILATFQTLRVDPEGAGDVVLLAISLFRFVFTRRNTVVPSYLREALARDVGLSVGVRARGVLTLAIMTTMTGDADGYHRLASDLSAEALELADELGDPRYRAEALTIRSITWTDLEERDLAMESGQAALQLARGLDDTYLILRALLAVARASPVPSAAIPEIREALARARQLGDHAWTLMPLVLLAIAQGETIEGLEEARALNDEAMKLAEEIGSTFHRLILWSNAGGFNLLLGNHEEAQHYSRRALNLSRNSGGIVESDYWCIFQLSCVATFQGHYLLGAQLKGAHEAIAERAAEPLGGYWSQLEADVRHRCDLRLLEGLGKDEYALAMNLGKSLDVKRLYDLAMGRSDSTLRDAPPAH